MRNLYLLNFKEVKIMLIGAIALKNGEGYML